MLEAYLPRRPGKADHEAVTALFAGKPPTLDAQKVPETDWVTESQRGVEPIRAGRFYIHTPDHPASAEPGVSSFEIPASQAFGTGQHATTAGCLTMLSAMKQRGVVARNVADIGTGTGLLAFAALELWPRAHAVASDIDPVCAPVVAENAARNGFRIGARPGQLAVAIAAGMDDRRLRECGPYDLLIANILAGPLVELAPDFAEAVPPRGNLVLAGLLATQERAVRAAYRVVGFALAARIVNGDWSILWLRRRFVG
jgi:ribosomal protein L11 methyltransferase